MRKRLLKYCILLILVVMFVNSIVNASEVINYILDYTELFFIKLFPSAFIFFTLASLLLEYGFIEELSDLFKFNSSVLFVTIISLVSGFPSGAKYTVDLLDKGLISNKVAKYLLMFTHFPNPIFILGSVYTLVLNKKICFFMLLSIILSNLIIMLLFRVKEKSKYEKKVSTLPNFSESLSKCCYSSIKIIVNIYSISLFYYLISQVIILNVDVDNVVKIVISGVFDLVNGIFLVDNISNLEFRYFLILMFVSFGSISVHAQVKSIINKKINYFYFFFGRIISTCLSLVIFKLLIW